MSHSKTEKHQFLKDKAARGYRRNSWGMFCLAGSIWAATSSIGLAATKTWVGGNGLWTDAVNWNGGVPGSGDDAILSVPDTTVAYLGGPAVTLSSVTVSATGTASTLNIDSGTLTANRGIIGNASLGMVSQTAGTFSLTLGTPLTDGRLILGNTTGGTGIYILSGGTVLADIITVGGGSTPGNTAGTGTFTHSGGSVNLTAGSAGELIVGDVPNSVGTYTFTGGTLQAKNVFVAVSGTSAGDRKMIQTGGVATISESLQIGGFAGGATGTVGSYTLGGTTDTLLKTGNIFVGVSGTGTFTQEGGVNSLELGTTGVDRALYVGATTGTSGTGTYNLKSGTLTSEVVYVGNPGRGIFNQSGGVNNASQVVIDTDGTNATKGTYTITGGALITTGSLGLPGLLNTSEFNLNGGTVTVNGTAVGSGLDNRGTFTIAGGTLTGTAAKLNYGTMTGFGTISGTGALVNTGSIKFTGGTTTIDSPVTNNSTQTLEVNNSAAVFNGAVTNNGIFKTTAANVIFNAPYSGRGSLVSDPSTQTFNQDFSVSASGSLVGGAGDVFRFGANVTIDTNNNTEWNTLQSEMDFFGTPGNHNLTYPGTDLGPTAMGYTNNFAWSLVNIAAGNKLLNTNDRALYTDQLILGGGTAQIGTFTGNLSIYYDPSDPVNSYLANGTYLFASGDGKVAPLVPIPEPTAALALVFGSLVVGFGRSRKG